MPTAKQKPALKTHFERKSPSVLEIYQRLLAAARQLGPVIEEPKKTSIHLVNRTAFAGVMTRREYLILTVKSNRKLKSRRITKQEQTSANRYHQEIKLHSPNEVDAKLVTWLREAYSLSG